MASHRKLLAVELGAFGFFGLWAGCFAVLLADLTRALDLSPGPLGFALFVGAAASILAMATLGWTSDRLGRRMYLILVACVFGLGIASLALAWSFWLLVLALAVLSSATGLYDVGINASAVDLEQVTGRRFMSLLHAAFSGGAMRRRHRRGRPDRDRRRLPDRLPVAAGPARGRDPGRRDHPLPRRGERVPGRATERRASGSPGTCRCCWSA